MRLFHDIDLNCFNFHKWLLSRLLGCLAIAILFLTMLTSIPAYAQEEVTDKPVTAVETLPETTDVHYTGKYCPECHEKVPKKGGKKFLKFAGDYTQLCRCHGYTPGTYIHPVNIVPSDEKKKVIPKDLPLEDGKLTCLTCHDISMQCEGKDRLKVLNKRFLRGAPFAKRTDLCFRCHDERKYKMLDPHNQLTKNGDIVVEKCLYCHVEKPDEKHARFKDVKLVGNLEVLCQRCHGERDHPANADHLRKPSAMTLKVMKQGEKQFNIVLPLDNGKITCVTCHNPHEKGVIPAARKGAKGADEKYRLRLPGRMCMACHQK
ncbi:MAG TPA: hypothetical protein ENH31_07770 [Nitrospirae bacterium]|nr:doubled CXXCH motif [bacterium BMS3Abin10]GBE38452.1 doubled CXXCH motif [bacterium BMS3Bbin08]HDH51809.1 hypothetical protein [Nitrospirota bacterium]HDK82449.1 hypothetical protein [Nitrospirota bacterium]